MEINQAILDLLTKYAAQDVLHKDAYFSMQGYSPDDAYFAGMEAGEAVIARKLLSMLNGETSEGDTD